ncbi:ABC transporter substrate-binding protein [Streptomyces sp. NPDC059479]|uniref:ABC transporter substrate-binding protein n=1 Tax=Streptomyces sp. NPDC059479 TaxID=3346848 RepID=UPI0036C70D3C
MSLDIPKHYDGNVMQIMALATEKLEHISAEGKLTPGLATSATQPTPTTIVYTIRSGVKFSDGSALTADDVTWSLQHLIDVKAGAQTAGNASSVAGVESTGPLEVTVTLKFPDATARSNLAVIGFVQQAKFAKAHPKDLGTPTAVPLGTGPYSVATYGKQAVKLVRNPHYWGTKPQVDKINFTFIPQDNTGQLAMRSGSIQGALVGNLKTSDQWKAIDGSSLYSLPSLSSSFISLDVTDGPLSDIHVRKAIAHSIDRAGVLTAGYGKEADLLTGMVPEGVLTGVEPTPNAAKEFLDGLPQYDFDLAKAKEELALSKYPKGFSLTIPVLAGVPYSEMAILNLQQNMKQLGVKITPKTQSQNQYIDSVYGHAPGPQTLLLVAPIPDPVSIIGKVTGKVNIAPRRFNLANWTTPETEAAHTKLMTSMDKAGRWEAAQTLLTAIAEEVPYVPLYNPSVVAVLGDGYTFDKKPTFFDLDVNGTWVHALKAR